MSEHERPTGSTASPPRRPRALVLVFRETLSEAESLVSLAHAYPGSRPPVVAGLIPVAEGISLSTAATAAQGLRGRLRRLARQTGARLAPRILVSHEPAAEVAALADESGADLVVLPWLTSPRLPAAAVRSIIDRLDQACTVVRGPLPARRGRALISLQADPDGDLALRLALDAARAFDWRVTAIQPPPPARAEPAGVALQQVLDHLAGVDDAFELAPDAAAFDRLAAKADLCLSGFDDPRTRRLRRQPHQPWIGTRAARPERTREPASPGVDTISILVDKWFGENTFHADEFEQVERLVERKRRRGTTISLALPALNEEETVGNVIRTLKRTLMDDVPLLDEIVLIDSDSSDATRDIAADLGIPVYTHQQVLPSRGSRPGKGEALWKSLHVTRGDLIAWIDTDIVNIHPRFVYGLIGPLLLRKEIMLVKGFYLRPMRIGDRIQVGGGGRVTELTARPLLNLFYPALSGLIQPLAGEYAGRRSALERLPFSSGYGVEIGLLIDTLERFGLEALAQVDLLERVHRNQPLPALTQMSFAIIQTVVRRLDRRYSMQLLPDVNRSLKVVQRHRDRYFLEVAEIAERERPPIIGLPEYRRRRRTGGGA